MRDIFIFTASDKDAQKHWRNSIASPVNPGIVYGNFPEEQTSALRAIEEEVGAFYCWGATPGDSNIPNWERMQIGSHILGYHTKHYRCVTSVVAKFHNRKFAQALWSEDKEGKTWEYVYFLTEPTSVSIPVKDLSDLLGGGPQGYYRVADSRMENIDRLFDSFDDFVEQRLMRSSVVDVSDLLSTGSGHPAALVQKHEQPKEPSIEDKLKELAKLTKNDSEFNPENLDDARERVLRSIVTRRGQPDFRRKLLLAYGEKCAVTGYDSTAALEAAHIIPYKGERTNDVTNGLLLRSDIHTLFDCGKVAVDTKTMTIVLADDLQKSRYRYLAGKKVHLPIDKNCWPSSKALDQHRKDALL